MFMRFWLLGFLILCPAVLVRADRLQLANGDEIEGQMLEMSDGEVKFKHSILGTFTIPRAKIHAIELGDQRGGKRIMADGSKADAETPEEIVKRLVNPDLNRAKVKEIAKGAKQHGTPDAAIEQLRREGVSGGTMQMLQAMLPGFGSPVVQKHFEDRVTGLMSGSIGIQDIRAEAIDARDQLKELMDDLGPGGEALKGYYGILDGFIEETDPNGTPTLPGIPPLGSTPKKK